jgi:hypothetical protein
VARPLTEDRLASLIMGVDIARQGSDQTVIRFRREQIVTRGRWRTPLQQQGWSTPDAEPTIHKPIAAKRAGCRNPQCSGGRAPSQPRPEARIPMLWTLGDDRKSVGFAVPPLRLAGMPEPVHAFIEFDVKTVDAMLERLTILRSQMLPPLPAPGKTELGTSPPKRQRRRIAEGGHTPPAGLNGSVTLKAILARALE